MNLNPGCWWLLQDTDIFSLACPEEAVCKAASTACCSLIFEQACGNWMFLLSCLESDKDIMSLNR